MRLVRILSVLLCVAVGTSGCVEPFSADVDPPSPRPLVIDGGITTGPGPHSVTLFLAAAFEQSLEGDLDRISGAEVIMVNDSTGSRTLLQKGDLIGNYRTQEGEIVGRPGHAYHVEITLPDGREYRSIPERMPEPVPIDTLSTEWDSNTERIKVIASASDPADTSNFYRWSTRVTRELVARCWQNVSTSSIFARSDRLVEGNLFAEEVFSIEPGTDASFLHQVDVQQRAITQEAHAFWSKVQTQIENAGDPFSPPPAPIRGNVVRAQDSTNFALGYFEVAGTAQRQTVCFAQADVEGAPTPPPAQEDVCRRRNVSETPPSYWTCSENTGPEDPSPFPPGRVR